MKSGSNVSLPKLTTREAIRELEALARAHQASARVGGISETDAADTIAALNMAIEALRAANPCQCTDAAVAHSASTLKR